MANKALKTLARDNTATLNRAHLTTLTIHTLFILYRLFFRHGSWKKYVFLTLPSVLLQLYLEKLGRPKYAPNGELKNAGEDLAGKGLMEYCWDVVYVSWIVLGVAGLFGEWAWWIMTIVPLYAAFLAWTTYSNMRQGIMPGMPAAAAETEAAPSKRQKKMEARGGKVRYR